MSAIPATHTYTEAAPRLRAATRFRKSTLTATDVMARALAFSFIAGLSFLASSMGGQVMVEQARRDGISALGRSVEARRAESILRRKVESQASLSSIQSWAESNGFHAPEEMAGPSVRRSLVASR
jgi:hypothetical protein